MAEWQEIDYFRGNLLSRFPKDNFLEQVLEGIIRVGRDNENPIRGNLVASALRETCGHILYKLAPDHEVRECIWFVQAKDTPTVTRRQKAEYIFRAGLPNDFVKETLKFELDEITAPLLGAMNDLNKHTHVREDTVLFEEKAVLQMLWATLGTLIDLVEDAAYARKRVEDAVIDALHNSVFQKLIADTIQELDELSTHTLVEGHHMYEIEVSEMNSQDLNYQVWGEVEVELQYGSDGDFRRGDGVRMGDSYPYSATITSSVSAPLDISTNDIELTVDNSSFYE